MEFSAFFISTAREILIEVLLLTFSIRFIYFYILYNGNDVEAI